MILETKLNSSFPKGQFNFLATLDHINLIGMEMVVEYFYSFVRIPSKHIESQIRIEGFFVETNIRRKYWFLSCF